MVNLFTLGMVKILVLLPTVSEDYRSSTKFTNLQSGKVGLKTLLKDVFTKIKYV
jgi:hypothetical protein